VTNVRDWFIAEVIFLSLKALRLIPMESAVRIFERFARWFGPKIKRHQVAMANLELAFPEKSIGEREKIASDSWAQIARTLLEYGYLDVIFDLDEESKESERIEITNPEIFLKLRDDGLPAILFTGHLANFELLPMAAAKFGLEIQSLFRQPNNKYAAARVADARKDLSKNLIASGAGASFQLMSHQHPAGQTGAAIRLPGPRRPHHTPAGRPVPARNHRRTCPAPHQGRRHRYQRHDRACNRHR
jgi:KDO2-lipid IV(A) lauroyltransferase